MDIQVKREVYDLNLAIVPYQAPEFVENEGRDANTAKTSPEVVVSKFKQFWKAGDYEGIPIPSEREPRTGGFDHVRVHPKFLHSNATSHKWALGAFAELLDNALDEVCSGATYVNVDMVRNDKDCTPMLLIEDNGGGMDPDKVRQCMSLGYSAKSKLPNTIGQYGNGFKTSTMRLGADVIVFSHCPRKDTRSIGLLSYTFLRSTGKEDIVVPILDYKKVNGEWEKIIRSSEDNWNRNVETIIRWSPFANEEELVQQFCTVKDRGTRLFIYNLWVDEQGQLELDFDSDPNDIQIRGVNRDEKSIEMAVQYPNSKHFLTYKHSLRSYVSILYLRLPYNFRIILRGKEVEHHNIVNDMMMGEEVTYRPQAARDSNMFAVVTLGFVKDARAHVDVQGFNVYHKNRLIKPFWRVWNAPGSDGRGVIGVLEANFVEPAHDKQGFERTTVLARLESRLVNMQKNFWNSNCHHIGYAPRRNKKANMQSTTTATTTTTPLLIGYFPKLTQQPVVVDSRPKRKFEDTDLRVDPSQSKFPRFCKMEGGITVDNCRQSHDLQSENRELRERANGKEVEIVGDLIGELQKEKDNRVLLEKRLQEAEQKIEELNKEQDQLIHMFSEERTRRDIEEEKLRVTLIHKSTTIQHLLEKLRLFETYKR